MHYNRISSFRTFTMESFKSAPYDVHKCHGDTEEHKSDYIDEPTMQQAFVILKERNMTHNIYLRLEYHVLHFIYTDYIFY